MKGGDMFNMAEIEDEIGLDAWDAFWDQVAADTAQALVLSSSLTQSENNGPAPAASAHAPLQEDPVFEEQCLSVRSPAVQAPWPAAEAAPLNNGRGPEVPPLGDIQEFVLTQDDVEEMVLTFDEPLRPAQWENNGMGPQQLHLNDIRYILPEYELRAAMDPEKVKDRRRRYYMHGYFTYCNVKDPTKDNNKRDHPAHNRSTREHFHVFSAEGAKLFDIDLYHCQNSLHLDRSVFLRLGERKEGNQVRSSFLVDI
jgi:hypothetical protein